MDVVPHRADLLLGRGYHSSSPPLLVLLSPVCDVCLLLHRNAVAYLAPDVDFVYYNPRLLRHNRTHRHLQPQKTPLSGCGKKMPRLPNFSAGGATRFQNKSVFKTTPSLQPLCFSKQRWFSAKHIPFLRYGKTAQGFVFTTFPFGRYAVPRAHRLPKREKGNG